MLKGSILISFILWLLGLVNSWYESSLLGRAIGTLGRLFSFLLGGSFLGRLVERDVSGGVFHWTLTRLTNGVEKTQVGLSSYLKEPLKASFLGHYMASYKSLKKGLLAFGLSLLAFGLVTLFRDTKKLAVFALALGLGSLLGGLILGFLDSSHVGSLLTWMKDLVYEEDGHDQDLQ